MDLEKIKNIHMIGIKGVGMTMLAQFLASRGYAVSGSDGPEVFMTDQILAAAGIKVKQNFAVENIPEQADLIIYSSAYNPENNVELAAALAGREKKTYAYAEVLAEFFNRSFGIAVCGSHGKTTTTAWLGYVLERSGLKPNCLVGARVEQFAGAGVFGDSDYMIIEADEYQNKLKYYEPKAILMNNIDHDHHDFFPTLESYVSAFAEFMKKIPKKGFLVANFDDAHIAGAAGIDCRGKVLSYALDREDVNFFAYDIKQQGLKQYFKVRFRDQEGGRGRQISDTEESENDELGAFAVSLPGRHNIYNALAVIAAAIELGAELKDIRTYLEEFTGTDRRFKILGKFNGATIIDDYGHHPTEIRATLAAARAAFPDNKIIAVFHPHTFTRTKALLDEFAGSFTDADKTVVLDIYGSAREAQGGVSSRDLIDKMRIKEPDKEFVHVKDLKECEEYLRASIRRDEVVILIGAGDVFRVGEALAGKK